MAALSESERARSTIMAAVRGCTSSCAPRGPRAAQNSYLNQNLYAEVQPPHDAAARAETFRRRLEAVGGHCFLARDESEAAQHVSRVIDAVKATRIATSGAPALLPAREHVGPRVEWFEAGAATRGELFGCEVGLTSAQWAVAETGTLVLESESERHRLASLVPPVHVAILEASRVLSTYGEALAALRRRGRLSHAVTFITGPSRTADIELTLALGVHGPREVYVILVGA